MTYLMSLSGVLSTKVSYAISALKLSGSIVCLLMMNEEIPSAKALLSGVL